MATTTNFGWETPDDTDLVKDGALAMRTLGNAIDASMVDLKGGTTGQVLSKTSNTDMDFTWVTSDDANAIQNAIVDAKGDLIAASAADTPARLAVGNNGETLLADSSTSTGLRYNPIPAAGKNLLINGNMAIAQRGTSSTYLSEGQYRLDRWGTSSYQSANHQQVTTGSTTVPSYYALRSGSATTAQAAGGARCDVAQQVETALAQNFAGRTVTLSFWVKFSAATIANSGSWLAYITTSTSSDPAMGTTVFTGLTETTINSGSYPTSWTKYSITGTIPTNARSIRVRFYFNNLFNTTNANDAYFDITGVQLELGSVATEFTLSSGTLAGELAACQRYLPKTTWTDTIGYAYGTNTAIYTAYFPVTPRVNPTGATISGTSLAYALNTSYTVTPAYNQANTSFGSVTVSSGLTITAGQGSRLTNGEVLWTGCEL